MTNEVKALGARIKAWLTEGVDIRNPKHREACYRMLQTLVERQTADEQAAEQTTHTNGMGFTGADAQFLTSVALKSRPYGNITERQAVYVVKKLRKYSNQLATAKLAGE